MTRPVTRQLERLATASVRKAPGVRVEWHDRLTPPVEDAYLAVGGDAWVPTELLRGVIDTPGPHPKRIATLIRDGEPWAVVPLRLAGRFWEPVMQGVVPEIPDFPYTSNPEGVLAALNLNVGCWASSERPSGWKNLRWIESSPCYEIDLSPDPEGYWRARQLWKTITQARKRTAGFELVEDNSDACAWSIEAWKVRFDRGADDQVAAKWNDRITVARWALPAGWRMHSWHLRDGKRWIAGATGFVNEGRLTLGTVHRDPEYDWTGAGNRCFDEAFRWARANGVRTVSLGSEFDYKRRWAPPAGRLWNYVVAPLPVHAWNGMLELPHRLAMLRRGR